MNAQKTIVIISGPTASGKTSLAIQAARYFQTEIISCDSRQCYKELNIGVARPSDEELRAVPHHFIASHSIHDKITAAYFEEYALALCEKLFVKHDRVVMAGGTGLYIKAFCEGMDEIPEVPEAIRAETVASYNANGLLWLQNEVQRLDPAYFDRGETRNPHRLLRALQVFKTTGRSILAFQTGFIKPRPFNIVKIALHLPKLLLHERINRRVDLMLDSGLLEEVRGLIPYQHLAPLQTVGYRELFEYFDGETSLIPAVERIKINTRRYAKRQMTWLARDQQYSWFDDPETALGHISKLL